MLLVIVSCTVAGGAPVSHEPTFFPVVNLVSRAFPLKNGWGKALGTRLPCSCNSPRGLCERSLVPVSFLLSGECFPIQLIYKKFFFFISTI